MSSSGHNFLKSLQAIEPDRLRKRAKAVVMLLPIAGKERSNLGTGTCREMRRRSENRSRVEKEGAVVRQVGENRA